MKKLLNEKLAQRAKSKIPLPIKAHARSIINAAHRTRNYFIRLPHSRGTYNSLDPRVVREYNKHRRAGPRKLVCYLPFNSISFCGGGRALACTYNQHVEFGTYPQQSLKEIWFGETGKRLREYMEHNDLSFGCQHCEYFLVNRVFTGVKAQVFDRYSCNRRGQFPRVMEFDLTNTCNLECIMCNGNASSAIRRNRERLPPVGNPYDAEFVRQLEEFIPHLREAKFFGGEPFLIDIYFDIWERILEINPDVEMFVLTNGTILNDRVKDVLNRGKFTLGVSIDAASKETYERIRINASYEAVMRNLTYFAGYSREHRRGIVVSTTLMRENWEEIPKMIDLCNSIGATTYLSYLKRPPRFALWNLPPATLQAIHETLARHELPEETENQRFNKRCYDEFLGQLLSWKGKCERGEELERWE